MYWNPRKYHIPDQQETQQIPVPYSRQSGNAYKYHTPESRTTNKYHIPYNQETQQILYHILH